MNRMPPRSASTSAARSRTCFRPARRPADRRKCLDARRFLARGPRGPMPTCRRSRRDGRRPPSKLVHATTVATNAILERRGRAPALSPPRAFATCWSSRRIAGPRSTTSSGRSRQPLVRAGCAASSTSGHAERNGRARPSDGARGFASARRGRRLARRVLLELLPQPGEERRSRTAARGAGWRKSRHGVRRHPARDPRVRADAARGRERLRCGRRSPLLEPLEGGARGRRRARAAADHAVGRRLMSASARRAARSS